MHDVSPVQIKENVSMFPPASLKMVAYLQLFPLQSTVQLLPLALTGQIISDPSHPLPEQSMVREVAAEPLMDRNLQSSMLQSICASEMNARDCTSENLQSLTLNICFCRLQTWQCVVSLQMSGVSSTNNERVHEDDEFEMSVHHSSNSKQSSVSQEMSKRDSLYDPSGSEI